MAVPRRALALLALLLLVPVFVALRGGGATAIPTAVINSPNVELLTTVPGSAAISGEFSPSAPFFYTSGLDSVSVFDVSDPRNPRLTGKLANLVFENEAMSYGERRDATGAVVRRFVLIGIDLYQVAPGADRTSVVRNVGGAQVAIVDVTDPADPKILSRTPGSSAQGGVTTSTHTVQCLSLSCDYAYSAGDQEGFSILDLRDLTKPVQVKTVKSPAGDVNPVFSTGGGHFWDIDDSGMAWHTGAGGTAGFDVTDPLNPLLVTGTNPDGAKTPLNDFIHHNSARPNARSFTPGATPSLANGNVALVTEEDYASEGDEVVCDRSGTFQTWAIPDQDGAAYRAANPEAVTGRGTMTPLDSFQAPAETGGGASTPVGGFCSAHWFDYHQSGIVAQGWYQQGLRLIDPRDPTDIKQFGFFTAGASQVWDAYWVPARNADGTAKADREKTNIVYTADAVRGLDVFEVSDLPPAIAAATPATTTKDPFQAPPTADPAAAPAPAPGAAPPASGPPAGSPTTPTAGVKPVACGTPTSTFAKGSALRTSGPRLKGTATPGANCTLRGVTVAIGRKTGGGCRFLQPSGRFGAVRSCLRTQYVAATGTTSWSLSRKVRLPRGSYVVWSRATNSAGTVERKARTRNLRQLRVVR